MPSETVYLGNGDSMRIVYLTHMLKDSIDWKAIARITRYALTSVEPGYSSLRRVLGIRRHIPIKYMVFDSGGFAAFTKGLNINVEKTILLYKAVKYNPLTDYLIELDNIPLYSDSRRTRFSKIRKNLENYIVMRQELGDRVLYVVHGWSIEEVSLAIQQHLGLDNKVAVGSYYVASVLNKAPKSIIFKRFNNVMRNTLKADYKWILVLGGSGPNMIHLSFYLGASAVDGVAWRNAARRKEIIVPGVGVRALNNSKRKKLTNEDLMVLKSWWSHELNPFKDMRINEFLKYALKDFKTLALWNAAAMKIEEEIANEFSNDHDRYYMYLQRRWSNNSFWRNILKIVKSDYVQNKLTVYLREKL